MIDQTLGSCTHYSLLPLSHTTTSGRTRSGSAKTGEDMTQRQPRLVLSVWFWQVQIMQAAGRGKLLVQGKNNRYPQICSFTACGGGVSGVSFVGNVVREAASQCGDGKGSVLPMEVLLCLLACFLLVKKSQEIGCVRVCVRDVVKPTGKAGQCRTAGAVRW